MSRRATVCAAAAEAAAARRARALLFTTSTIGASWLIAFLEYVISRKARDRERETKMKEDVSTSLHRPHEAQGVVAGF